MCVSECGGVRHLRWGCTERSCVKEEGECFAPITPRGCDLERGRASDCASAENHISDKKEHLSHRACSLVKLTFALYHDGLGVGHGGAHDGGTSLGGGEAGTRNGSRADPEAASHPVVFSRGRGGGMGGEGEDGRACAG